MKTQLFFTLVLALLLPLAAEEKQVASTTKQKEAEAGGPQIHAQCSTNSFFLGENFFLDIMINGSDTVLPFKVINNENFQFKLLSETPIKTKNDKAYHIRLAVMP